MKIVPDRDKYRRWYLDSDVVIVLDNGDELHIEKGYRFDGHSVYVVVKTFFALSLLWALLFLAFNTLIGLLSVLVFLFGIASLFVIFIFKRYDTEDIIAALAHDFLLDTAPWHRYNRRCIDNVYKELMHRHARPFRRFWMPLAVTCYGHLFHYWRDNKPTNRKYRTVVKVHVV